MDPFAPARPERNPFDEPDHPSLRIAPTSAQLPPDFDPLAPEPPRNAVPRSHPGGQFAGRCRTRSDLPAEIGQMPLHAGGMIPGDDLLPDDWDKDLLEGIAPAGGGTAGNRPPQPVRAHRRRNRLTPNRSSTVDEPPVARRPR